MKHDLLLKLLNGIIPSVKIVTIIFSVCLIVYCNNNRNSTTSKEVLLTSKIDKLKLQPGFIAEHLYSPSENGKGSWVSMTFDHKGRIIASDQYGTLYRMQLPAIGAADGKLNVEQLNIQSEADSGSSVTIGYAQGLLYAFNSLYVMINNRADTGFDRPSGLYRLQDTNNDDQFDKISFLKKMEGSGEHGPHSVVLSPDKKHLYVIAGNNTDVAEMDAYLVPPVWEDDNLFPLIRDPNGADNTKKPPAGWVARTDSAGTFWELVSSGLRNPFDLAFNESGDLFTYDADMEYDQGLPWYRPTRICHITSGSEFGWRVGNRKWPPENADNLPLVLNIGQGSPTNLVSAHTAHFPEKYRNSLLAFDWSFGIIHSIHLKESGSSYTGSAEEFVSGAPLPLTDGTIGPDGALYFITGGRRLDSDMYRVYYKENSEQKNEMTSELSPGINQSSKIRRQLEGFHGKPDRLAQNILWPYLKDNDRFIRFAARIALEHQPVSQWQELVLTETDPQILTQGMIALARHGDKKLEKRMLDAIMKVDASKSSASLQQDMLRAVELTLSRMGKPGQDVRVRLINYLDPQYPGTTNIINRSLSKILLFLEAPQLVVKTMDLIEAAKDDSSQQTATESADMILRNPQYGLDIGGVLSKTPPAQQVSYAIILSQAKSGWTQALREKYFKWYYTAFGFEGGRSYIGFIDRARKNALANVPKDQFEYYNKISGNDLITNTGMDLANIGRPKGPGRDWQLAEAVTVVQDSLVNRNFEQGKMMFAAARCAACHTMKGQGGTVGPDLTQLGTRFSVRDILESVIEPSKVISDQYAATNFNMRNGRTIMGRLIKETNEIYFISQNPFAPLSLRELLKKDVASVKISNISSMYPGMINSLSEEELKDLVAYLISGGNNAHKIFNQNTLQNE